MTLAFSRALAIALLGLSLPCAAADAPDCSGFGWDMSRELALFAQAGHPIRAAAHASAAPRVDLDTLYIVTLAPRADVAFAHPPGKVVGGDAGTAGLLVFHPARAGSYRITLDAGMWIDAVNGNQLIDSTGFRGRAPCGTIHKSVEWSLPAADVVVQISGPATAPIHLTITSTQP